MMTKVAPLSPHPEGVKRTPLTLMVLVFQGDVGL